MRVKMVWLGWTVGLSSIGASVWLVITYDTPALVMAFGAGMLFLITTLNWWMGLGK